MLRRSRIILARLLGGAAVGASVLGASLAQAHDVEPPKPKIQPAPAWPGTGEPDSHDVVVPVIVVVDETGHVSSAEVEASVSPEFDVAALNATKSWDFEPAVRDGKAVSARIRSIVRFAGVSRRPKESESVAPAPAPAAPPAVAAAAASEPQIVHVSGEKEVRSASEIVRGRDVVMAAPHRTASDVLNVVPGVFVTQHSGEGKAHQIFLRGFDAVHGQDLELWVGGAPVNEVSNVHGQGYADLHFVMPEVIREVQATPGTYDPRQGDFAVAGSVRMKLGYAEPGATIKGAVGSFGGRRLFLAYHPKDSSEETFAAGEVYETDGFGPNRAARRASAIVQATHDFSEGVALRVLASTYAGRYDSAGVVPASSIESGQLDRLAVLDPKQGGHSTRTQVVTELHKDEGTGRWSFAPFIAFRTLQIRQNLTGYLVDATRSGQPKLESDNTQQINDSITIGSTASFRKTLNLFSPRDSIEVGTFGRHDVISQAQRRLSELNDASTETLADADVRGTNVAAYVDTALHVLPKLVLRGGIRADALSYTVEDRARPDGSSVSAARRAAQGAHFGKKLTLDYNVLPRTNLLLSYGDGFRSPQARGLSEGQRTFFTEVTSYELGVRYGEGSRVSTSVAGFHTRLSEDLAFDPVTARNETVPGTERKGIACELTIRPNKWFLLSSSATYTHASFRSGNAVYGEGDLLPYVPQLVVRSDVAVQKGVARIGERDLVARAGLGLEGLAGRPLPYGESGQNVFLVDASASLRLKEVEFGVDAFNLVDSNWYDGQFVYASNFGRAANPSQLPTRHVTVGPPRTLFFSLTLYV